MPSNIDPTRPEDGIPASKADLRANLAVAKAELEHGGFVEGQAPVNYAAATSKVSDHLAGIDAALGAAGGGDASTTSYTAAGTGAITRTVQDKLREVVSIRDFGVVGDGVSDDTTAINNAIAYALGVASQAPGFTGIGPDASWEVTGVGLYFPPGVYRWNSTAINFPGTGNNPHKHITLLGGGPSHTVIRITNNDYFISFNPDIESITIEGIRFAGTYKGVFKGGAGQALTRRGYYINRCQFVDFTECAIGHDADDCPFWSIEYCQFHSPAANAICIALGGLSDESRIVHNEFWAYRYAIKNGNTGANIYIKNNWFAGPASVNEADIWLVPKPSNVVNALWGTVIAENKFGNEGHASGVPHIIVADENALSGTSFRNRVHATTESTGWVVGVHVRDNLTIYAGGELLTSFIKSWCTGIAAWVIGPNMLVHMPKYILEFDAVVTTDVGGDYVKQNTIFQPNFLSQDLQIGASRYSNQAWRFNVMDPYALFQGQPVHHSHGGVTDDPGVVMWMNADAQADGALSGATRSAVTDPHGGNSATTVRYTRDVGYAVYNASFASEIPINSPMFVEVDCKIAASQPLTLLNVWIRRSFSLERREMARTIVLTSGWQTVRIPFIMSPGVGRDEVQLLLQPGDFAAGSKTDVMIHNPRLYEARQPVNFGHLRTRGSGAWSGPHMVIGVYHLWIDTGGRLRIKSGVPTFDADGAIVGTQT
jgi:hypothetical protein